MRPSTRPIVALVALSLVVAACGDDDASPPQTTAPASETSDPEAS